MRAIIYRLKNTREVLQPLRKQSDLFTKIVYGMIVVAKLSLFIVWLMAFVVTCLVIGLTFPVLVLFDKFQMLFKEVSL